MSYRVPPDAAGMAQAERAIRRAGVIGLVAYGAAAALGWLLLPRVIAFPLDLAERLAFAARAAVPVLLCLAIAVAMVSTARRTSPQDIGGAAAGPPSERLAIRVAFLQNTLEQAVLAVGAYLALATLLTGAWLTSIPVAAAFFVVGRVLFYRGYPGGAAARAPGMVLTMLPTLVITVAAAVLLCISWITSPSP